MAHTQKQAKQIEKSKKIDHSVLVINFKVHHLGILVPRYSLQTTQKLSDTHSQFVRVLKEVANFGLSVDLYNTAVYDNI